MLREGEVLLFFFDKGWEVSDAGTLLADLPPGFFYSFFSFLGDFSRVTLKSRGAPGFGVFVAELRWKSRGWKLKKFVESTGFFYRDTALTV